MKSMHAELQTLKFQTRHPPPPHKKVMGHPVLYMYMYHDVWTWQFVIASAEGGGGDIYDLKSPVS